MTDPTEAGPFLNDDGDIMFPVDAWDWNAAQSEAAGLHRDSDRKSKYAGKVEVHLCGEDWEDCESTEHQRLAYLFTPGAEWYQA